MLGLAFGGLSLWWVRYLVGHVSGESSYVRLGQVFSGFLLI